MKKYVFEICIKRTYPAQSRGENHTTITAFYGYNAYRVVLSAALLMCDCVAIFQFVENCGNNGLQIFCVLPLFYLKWQLEHSV